MNTEIFIVLELVIAFVLLINAIPAAGLLIYFAIANVVAYCAGWLNTEKEKS